jgi:cholesterol transport system auxiliary component
MYASRLANRCSRGAAVGALLALVLLVAGCSVFKKDFTDRKFYALEVIEPGLGAAGEVYLEVRPFRSVEPATERLLIYRDSANAYRKDFYNLLITSPQALVGGLVAAYLADAGLFAGTVRSGSLVDASHFLEGSVTALYGDYAKSGQSSAVIEVQLFLLESREGRMKPLIVGEYREAIPMDRRAPDKLVEGWNEGLQRILERFCAEVEAAGFPRWEQSIVPDDELPASTWEELLEEVPFEEADFAPTEELLP